VSQCQVIARISFNFDVYVFDTNDLANLSQSRMTNQSMAFWLALCKNTSVATFCEEILEDLI
jgi:hypothetical protein